MNKNIVFLMLVALVNSVPALAGFEGDYAPENWVVTEPGPLDPEDVDVIGSFLFAEPFELIIDSPDCTEEEGGDQGPGCFGPPYIMAIETEAVADGFVEFEWGFDTADGPFYDSLGIWRNGEFNFLVDQDGSNLQFGSAGFNVLAGDMFGFGLLSEDSCCGASQSIIEFFTVSAPAGQEDYGIGPPGQIPLPASVWLLGSALAGLVGISRRRKQA